MSEALLLVRASNFTLYSKRKSIEFPRLLKMFKLFLFLSFSPVMFLFRQLLTIYAFQNCTFKDSIYFKRKFYRREVIDDLESTLLAKIAAFYSR